MNAEEVLRQARSRGATFHVMESGRIKVQAPSALPDELMEGLRHNKAAVLALLSGEAPKQAEPAGPTEMLAWAAHAAESGLVLPQPVHFLEIPLRPYTTTQVGRYCKQKLQFLALARSNRVTGGWGRFTPEWWQEMEAEALQALTALKAAIDEEAVFCRADGPVGAGGPGDEGQER
jgi:hypothetical protein